MTSIETRKKIKMNSMTNFETYYLTKFRQDINQFFSTIPDQSKFHEDNQNKQTLSIQYERLTREFDHMNFLSADDKVNFGVALFFTVLVDEVCYTHFHSNYETFRRLTLYPKFIGNCLSWCHYHLHPRDIFNAMNQTQIKSQDNTSFNRLDFYDKFNEAIPIMKTEILNFFKQYLSDVDEQQFWEKCKIEFPYIINNENTDE